MTLPKLLFPQLPAGNKTSPFCNDYKCKFRQGKCPNQSTARLRNLVLVTSVRNALWQPPRAEIRVQALRANALEGAIVARRTMETLYQWVPPFQLLAL